MREALGAEAPAAAVSAIVARADGNPFYLEELVRAAREGRSDGLPDSILGMVHARLDAEGDRGQAGPAGGQHLRRALLATAVWRPCWAARPSCRR